MLSHSVLLVVGGAVLTGLLGALVFGSSGTVEEQRLREEQKLLRALDAQRRIRDAQLMRRARSRGKPLGEMRRPTEAGPEPPAPDGQAIDEESAALHRAGERQRKREKKEQAAALKSEREAEKRVQRRAEQDRKSAAKAEQATLRVAKRQERQEAKAALKAEQATAALEAKAKATLEAEQARARVAAEARARVQPTPSPAAPAPEPERAKGGTTGDADETRPLSELPLFSWATRIEDDDATSREAS